MTNLIPPEGKSLIKREYYLRVLSVWALLATGLCVAVGCMLLPTYVLLGSELRALQDDSSTHTEEGTAYLEAEEVIQEANTIITQLSHGAAGAQASELIEHIMILASSGIILNRFETNVGEESIVDSVVVRGEAATRSDLAAFRIALEESPLFRSAEVPISDLARETELPFVITVILEQTNVPRHAE